MLKTIRDQDRTTKNKALNLSNIKMYRRDNMINGITERHMMVPIISISLTRQPGITWEFSFTDRVKTIHMLDSGHQVVHFLTITTSPHSSSWNLTVKCLSSYFIFFIPLEKQMYPAVSILYTRGHPSSLCILMTDLTNQS